MFKKKLFDEDSEEEVSLKTENEYAKKYDAWREKEEMHKLEQKYGSKALNSDGVESSDSEDESDEPPEVNEELEKQFLKTLALLKNKDPRIYDTNYKFFNDKEAKQPEKETKVKTLTFADSDDDGGDIFTIEKKAEIQEDSEKKNQKEEKLKEFLTGKSEHIDGDMEKDLEPLKALWSDPKLSEGEAFLRDYILNKRYLEEGDAGEAEDKLRDDDDLEADEKMVEEQGKFERAYNFRFEEPDDEYLKRFPRTMNYIRPKDDKRSRKRAEVRARKDDEKQRKMEEIARLKALKLKEIQAKIARIKEVTGNEDLAFEEEDIEGEFDPAEHDRRMRAIFDDHYYGEVDDRKPVFPDLDEELEIENWENYEREQNAETKNEAGDGPHCEDDNFNMDADYDPKQARTNLLEEIQRNLGGKKRRNRKKKSKLGELLTTEKPKFVPAVADKTYDQYMEEYYKMDCEDVIGGDLPTRFKYREVVPNDFGLTVEEILLADDKELTQWVPLKKIVKHRPETVEKGDVNTYRQKARDEQLKRKMLPSLYKHLPEEPEIVVPITEAKKKKKKKKNHENYKHAADVHAEGDVKDDLKTKASSDVQKKKVKKEKVHEEVASENNVNNEPVEDSSNVQEKKKKKHKKAEDAELVIDVNENGNIHDVPEVHNTINNNNSSKKKRKERKDSFNIEHISNEEPSQPSHADNNIKIFKNDDANIDNNELKRKANTNVQIQVPNKKKKKNKQTSESNLDQNRKKVINKKFKQKNKFKKQRDDSNSNPFSKLSDERLKAYGLNPKKYKNFLKFKKF